MAPIDVDPYYRNLRGQHISSRGRITVYPGCTATIEGKISTVQVTCNPNDDGGSLEIIEVADSVKVGGLTGVNGILGPKKVTRVGHSERTSVRIKGCTGIDEFNFHHDPYASDKSPI